MKLKVLFSVLLFSWVTQAKSLSEMVLDEQLKQKSNYVFSNTSVDGLLSLISYGLTEPLKSELSSYWGGLSLDKKARILGRLSEKSADLSVMVNYQIWVNQNYSLQPNYIKDVSARFSVVPEVMDVSRPNEVVESVNSWAADNTNNLIQDLITRDFVTQDLVTILANAVYFKGQWKDKFVKSLTQHKKFSGAGIVPTMHGYEGYKISWNKKDKVVVVELPFKGEKYSMVIAMPAKFKDFNFDTYEGAVYEYKSGKNLKKIFKNYILNSKAISELNENEDNEYSDLELPKFTIETSIDGIEEKLSDAGLPNLFYEGAIANMTNDPNTRISKIVQKAKIIVDEEGAEAAAVTYGGVQVISAELPPPITKINGPFAYMIKNNQNNERLFEGIVLNPTQ